jgi:hypothetical protein
MKKGKATGLGDFLCSGISTSFIKVYNVHNSSLFGKNGADGFANSASPACHNGNFFGKTEHTSNLY